MKNNERMLSMDIKELSIKTSIPMVISMISIALYGIVDTIFISNISKDALTCVSLCFPVIAIITAIGLGIGIGTNSCLAKALGEKDYKKVSSILKHSLFLSFIGYFLVLIFSIFGVKLFFGLFTKDSIIKLYGISYLTIICLFSFGLVFQILFEKILEAYGFSKKSMFIQFGGAIINLILDPILIFIFNMGISGAAISTILGQIIGMIIGFYFLVNDGILSINYFKSFKIENLVLHDILKVGIPTMLMEACESFITLFLNKVLIGFSNDAVSVWGIYCQLQKFVIIIVYGLNYGMIPIVAYNWGAKMGGRVKDCYTFFRRLAILVTFLGMIIFMFVPEVIINFYDVSSSVLKMGIVAFRILSIGFVFAGVSLVYSSLFQAFGFGTYSLIVNFSRKMIFSIPFIFIFKNIFGVTSIWISFAIAEVLTFILSSFLFYKVKSKIIDNI